MAGLQSLLKKKEKPARKRGFFFWALAPWLVLFIIVMGLLIDKGEPGRLIILVSIELLAILTLLGLFDAQRFWWAWRGVGAIVFLGYVAYSIAMLIEEWGAIKVPQGRGDASAINAILGLVAIGLPGLWYAVFGRLTFKGDVSVEANDELNKFDDENAVDSP